MTKGKVKFYNIDKGYGFLTDGNQDVYLHRSTLERAGIASLAAGQDVEYEATTKGDGKIQVSSIVIIEPTLGSEDQGRGSIENRIVQPRAPSLSSPTPPSPGLSQRPGRELYDWAYLWYLSRDEVDGVPQLLRDLQETARPERWSFGGGREQSAEFPEILFNYLIYTFYRLKIERKVLVSDLNGRPIAAFNTGLVDRRFEPIYAMFEPNSRQDSGRFWRLSGFSVSGEGVLGKNLVRAFRDLPREASYFDNINDLIFDTKVRNDIEFDKGHVVLDNINRFPGSFIEDNLPPGFRVESTDLMNSEQKKAYFEALANAIEAHDRTYRSIVNRVKDAIELAVKRIRWNFKTAIPQYYPVRNRLSLLLPLALQSDESADIALVVEKTQAGSYLGHTILTLPMAYKNARLICRPDSDWLTPDHMAVPSAADSSMDTEEVER